MPWVHQISKLSVKRQGLWPWVIACTLFAASLGLRFLLAPFLEGMKFITFYPAIALATLLCGWRQGTSVLVLSAVSAWYLFLEPTNSFSLKGRTTIGPLLGFLIVGGFFVLLVAALRETVRRVELAKTMQVTLFSELQHRVANNLQMVVGLIRIAQRSLRDPVAAAEKLNEAVDRTMAMAQLHRHINDGTAYVNGLEPLLNEMLANTFRELPVKVIVDVQGVQDLSIDQLTAITLLVNEAALNSFKHVFTQGRGNLFKVSLAKGENGHVHLLIEDDGPGIGVSNDSGTRSLGMGIMQAFAKQLGGSLEVADVGGASLSVEFAAAPASSQDQ